MLDGSIDVHRAGRDDFMKPDTVKKILIVSLILCAGLFLRVYDLGGESVWLDEVLSIKAAQSLSYKTAPFCMAELPLYNTILHQWIGLFGDSESSARFLSVIFGFLSMIMIFLLGRIIFNDKVGLLSSLLLGLSVFNIQYSQEARGYSLLCLLSAVSMYFFLKLLKKMDFAGIAGYLASSLLLMSTHIYGLFIIISQNIFFLLQIAMAKKTRAHARSWVLLQLALIAPLLINLNFIISRLAVIENMEFWWIPQPSMISMAVSFLEYSGSAGLMLIFIPLVFFSALDYSVSGPKAKHIDAPGSIEDIKWTVRLKGVDENLFLWVWLFGTIVISFLVSRFVTPVYWTRYTIGASFAFYILAASGIANVKNRRIRAIIVSAVIALSLSNILGYYNDTNKEPWREAAAYVDANAAPDDTVIFNSGICKLPFDYYSKRDDLIKKPFLGTNEIVDEAKASRFIEKQGYPDRIWAVISHSNDPENILKRVLKKYYNLSNRKNYESIRYLNLRFGDIINYKYNGVEVCLFSKRQKKNRPQ